MRDAVHGVPLPAARDAIGTPSTFWLHLVGGAFIGCALLSWFHTSDFDFALISIFAVAFVLVAYATKRSSWAFYGTIGFFAATIHYLIGSPTELVQGIFGISQRCMSLPSSLARVVHILGTADQPVGAGARVRPSRLLAHAARDARDVDRRKNGQAHAAVVVPPPAPAAE